MSLQNAASFLQSQASVISQMADVFSEIQSLTLTIAQGLSINDPFLTGQPSSSDRFTEQDPSILVQQFYSRVKTLWSMANETFGGVNLFKTAGTSEDTGLDLALADGTSVTVTKFNRVATWKYSSLGIQCCKSRFV